MNPFYFLAGLIHIGLASLTYWYQNPLLKMMRETPDTTNQSFIEMTPELAFLITTAAFAFGGVRMIYVSIKYPHVRSKPMILFLSGYILMGAGVYFIGKHALDIHNGIIDASNLERNLMIFLPFAIIALILVLIGGIDLNKAIKEVKNA